MDSHSPGDPGCAVCGLPLLAALFLRGECPDSSPSCYYNQMPKDGCFIKKRGLFSSQFWRFKKRHQDSGCAGRTRPGHCGRQEMLRGRSGGGANVCLHSAPPGVLVVGPVWEMPAEAHGSRYSRLGHWVGCSEDLMDDGGSPVGGRGHIARKDATVRGGADPVTPARLCL